MNQDFYKDLIYKGFFPSRNSAQPNFETSKKAIENYQTIADSPNDLIEMIFYYVEIGSDFINEFGGISEDTCMDLEDKFEEALKKIVENNLQSEFVSQCRKIADEASDGYGFSDSLQSNLELFLGN